MDDEYDEEETRWTLYDYWDAYAGTVWNFLVLVVIGGSIFGAIGGTAVGMLPFMFLKGLDYPQAETVMGCFQVAGMPFGIILSYLNVSYWR